MATSYFDIPTYSRYNLSESESDIHVFVKEYKERIKNQLLADEESSRSPFVHFADKRLSITDATWLKDNDERFLKDTGNDDGQIKQHYLSACGYVCCMIFSEDGEHIIVGHASGLIQMRHGSTGAVLYTLRNIQFPPKPVYALEYSKTEDKVCYAACMDGNVYRIEIPQHSASVEDPPQYCIRVDPALECLHMQFYGSPGIASYSTPFVSHRSAALSLGLTADQTRMIVGYGDTSIKVYDMETQEIQPKNTTSANPIPIPNFNFRFTALDEELKLTFLNQIENLLLNAENASRQTQSSESYVLAHSPPPTSSYTEITYKVHKLRLQFIPKKLQRMHFGQVCALKCHPSRPYMFATGGWDKTLRIWDVRCKVGCVMTFEGVDICSDSIDLVRDHCLAGSWQPTEALTVWDLAARKRLSIIRVQNRRPNVDGEYIYACKYWHSTDFNRKGKYAIIGGSGTNCVEVINLHNRYITCSYPATGTVLAVTSYQDRVAFGGTSTTFNIVKFYDPKHQKEKYHKEEEPDFDYTKVFPMFDNDNNSATFSTKYLYSAYSDASEKMLKDPKSATSTVSSKMSRIP